MLFNGTSFLDTSLVAQHWIEANLPLTKGACGQGGFFFPPLSCPPAPCSALPAGIRASPSSHICKNERRAGEKPGAHGIPCPTGGAWPGAARARCLPERACRDFSAGLPRALLAGCRAAHRAVQRLFLFCSLAPGEPRRRAPFTALAFPRQKLSFFKHSFPSPGPEPFTSQLPDVRPPL